MYYQKYKETNEFLPLFQIGPQLMTFTFSVPKGNSERENIYHYMFPFSTQLIEQFWFVDRQVRAQLHK